MRLSPASGRPISKLFTSPDQHDVLQWGLVPYDAEAKAFGFKASWRAASRMRERLKSGPVQLKVDIASTFYDSPNRTLIADIRGWSAEKPEERIVLAAHIQEPGANDDASGCGTLLTRWRRHSRGDSDGARPAGSRAHAHLPLG